MPSPRRSYAGCPTPPVSQAGQEGGLGKLWQPWQGGNMSGQRLTNELLGHGRENLSGGTGTGDSGAAELKKNNNKKAFEHLGILTFVLVH